LGKLERQLRRLTDCEQQIRQLAAKPTLLYSLRDSSGANSIPSAVHLKHDDYQQLVSHIRNVVRSVVPKGAHVLVVSKGDPELLKLPDQVAAHFPQSKTGGYAGHHPADSAAALAQLESLRRDENCYLLIPSTAFWWLGHYVEFRRHLEDRYQRFWNDDRCTIYDLSAQSRSPTFTENGNVPARHGLFARLRRRLAPGPGATNGRSHA
jgi:hypothetical protein